MRADSGLSECSGWKSLEGCDPECQVAAPGAARSPRRASLPSPLPALHLHHPRRAPGALQLSFAESSLRQSYKRCFHRWWRWKQVLYVCVCVCVCVCIRAHALGRGSALGGEVRRRPVISQKPDSSLCGRCKGTLRQNLFSLVTERMGSPCTWWTWTRWSRFPEVIVCLLSTAVL